MRRRRNALKKLDLEMAKILGVPCRDQRRVLTEQKKVNLDLLDKIALAGEADVGAQDRYMAGKQIEIDLPLPRSTKNRSFS